MLVSVLIVRVPAKIVWIALPTLMIAAFWLVSFADSAATGVGAFALAGLACSAFLPLTISLAVDRFPDSVAWVSSMLIAALMTGVGVGSWLVGALQASLPLDALYRLSSLYPILVLALAWPALRGCNHTLINPPIAMGGRTARVSRPMLEPVVFDAIDRSVMRPEVAQRPAKVCRAVPWPLQQQTFRRGAGEISYMRGAERKVFSGVPACPGAGRGLIENTCHLAIQAENGSTIETTSSGQHPIADHRRAATCVAFRVVMFSTFFFARGDGIIVRRRPRGTSAGAWGAKRARMAASGRNALSRFVLGNSGGPRRPKGSRNRLGEEFLADLYADGAEHGAAVIAAVRERSPEEWRRAPLRLLG